MKRIFWGLAIAAAAAGGTAFAQQPEPVAADAPASSDPVVPVPDDGMMPERPLAPVPGEEEEPDVPTAAVKQSFAAQFVEPTQADQPKIDQAYRNLKLKRWQQAASFFNELRQKYGTAEYELNYALCLYEMGQLDQARGIYENVLQVDPENIEALISIARIRARTAQSERDAAKQAQLLEAAREAIKRAAANGANALRAIKQYPELQKSFETDISLKIAIIREPQRPLGSITRDPFRNLLPLIDGRSGDVATSDVRVILNPEQQRKFVENVKARFAELRKLLGENPPNYEAIAKNWMDIEDMIAEGGERLRQIDLIQELKILQQEFKQQVILVQQLLLKAFYSQGERILEAMEGALQNEQYSKVFEGWEALLQLTKRMRATNESFGKAADDLEQRGSTLQSKATILAETEKIQFQITGIVVGVSVAKAIVNNRILGENDVVYDQRGNPITDLRIAVIKKRRVRFRYKGLEFERPLLVKK